MKKKSILIIVLAIISIYGCETTLTDYVAPDFHKKIVMTGLLQADSVVKITVSNSVNVLDTALIALPTNAIVQLFEDNNLIDVLQYTEQFNNHYYMTFPFYKSTKTVSANHTYNIKIALAGYTTVSAKTTIPKTVQILDIDTLTVIKHIENGGGYQNEMEYLQFSLRFKDAQTEENYYAVSVYGINSFVQVYDSVGNITDTVQYPANFGLETDDLIFDNNMNNYSMLYFSDKLINGNETVIKFKIPFTKDFQSYLSYYVKKFALTIRLQSISKDFYIYKQTLSKYYDTHEDPLSEPVQIYTNVENGAGILGSMSCASRTIEVPVRNWYKAK